MAHRLTLIVIIGLLAWVVGTTIVTWYQSNQITVEFKDTSLSGLNTEEINVVVNIVSLLDSADSLAKNGQLTEAMQAYELMYEGIDIVLGSDTMSPESKTYLREQLSPRYQLMAYDIMILAAKSNVMGKHRLALELLDRALTFLDMAEKINPSDPSLEQGYEDWDKTRQSIEDTEPLVPEPRPSHDLPLLTI